MKKVILSLVLVLATSSFSHAITCDSKYFCKDKFEFDAEMQKVCNVGVRAAQKHESLSAASKVCNEAFEEGFDVRVCENAAQDFLFYCR